MNLTNLALLRAGFTSIEAFQQAKGLLPTGREDTPTVQALLPYLNGYLLYRVEPGDTYTRIAQTYQVSVRSIITANPNTDPARLQIGQYLVVPLGFPAVPENISYTYEVLQLTVKALTARYPFIRLSSIGKTAYGRELYMLKIGIGDNRVLYNAAHHANEWLTTPVLLKFVEQYAEAVSEGGRIFGYAAQELYQKTSLYLVPMVNPDGVDLVTGGIERGSLLYLAAGKIADGFPEIPFPEGWKANLQGTDINLNYPAGWEQARENKFALGFDKPAPRDYVGTAPLSTAEARAMVELTQRLQPRLTLSYHSQGETIYWKYVDIEPPEAREIGESFAAVSGYSLEDTPFAAGFAGYKDWFILTFDRPGYTIEVGSGVSPLPWSQFGDIYEKNLGILTLGLTV